MPLPTWLTNIGYPSEVNLHHLTINGWRLIFDGKRGVIPNGVFASGDTFLQAYDNALRVGEDRSYTDLDNEVKNVKHFSGSIECWANLYGGVNKIPFKIYRHIISPAWHNQLHSTKRDYTPHPTAKPLPLP